MTDAEKYAKVFRAAADGIAKGAISREQYEVQYAVFQRANAAHVHMTYEWAVRQALTPVRGGLNTRSNDGDPYRLGMWDAYNGVASLFEKIVEAEKGQR